VPDAPGLELILAGINAEHPGAVLDTSFDREQAALIVDPAHILEVLTWLRDTEGQEYTFLASVHGADYLPAEPRFAVHYELLNRERYERLRVKAILPDPASETNGQSADPTTTFVPPAFGADKYRDPEEQQAKERLAAVAAGTSATTTAPPQPAGAGDGGSALGGAVPPETVDPTSPANHKANGAVPPETATPESPANHVGLPRIASCVELFPTAEFQEREVYDFFGIVFEGHPDLRRILMPEDYVGYPQRRDFPIGGEPVIFTRDEVSNPGWWQ
jgi:NADH:ubiquinone oxidoreductase subunit C